MSYSLNYIVRFYKEVENYMTSTQRCIEYTKLESEDKLVKKNDPVNWLTFAKVEFKNVTLRYREGLEPSLRNVSFQINSKEKVGVVGRTGAGKSSILQALFRLVELDSGTLLIDGIDVSKLGLHTLRKAISYIPQSPFLLNGTIRENLAPFNEFQDE